MNKTKIKTISIKTYLVILIQKGFFNSDYDVLWVVLVVSSVSGREGG